MANGDDAAEARVENIEQAFLYGRARRSTIAIATFLERAVAPLTPVETRSQDALPWPKAQATRLAHEQRERRAELVRLLCFGLAVLSPAAPQLAWHRSLPLHARSPHRVTS